MLVRSIIQKWAQPSAKIDDDVQRNGMRKAVEIVKVLLRGAFTVLLEMRVLKQDLQMCELAYLHGNAIVFVRLHKTMSSEGLYTSSWFFYLKVQASFFSFGSSYQKLHLPCSFVCSQHRV